MDDFLLLGYLLETLDPPARKQVEAELQVNPDTRNRLIRLQAVLAPLAEDAADPDLPPNLVLRTLAHVAEHTCPKRASLPMPRSPLAWSRGSWGRADVLVAACMFLVMLALVPPLISRLWQRHDRYACANNLRKFWGGLSVYADTHSGSFPRVEETGPRAIAGIFIPMLGEAGLLDDVSIDCPNRGNRHPRKLRLADLDRLYAERRDEYNIVARHLAGHYAYSLGYSDDASGLRGLRRDSGDGLPILADRAGSQLANSDNHGGTGQNVLHVGGHVLWATIPTIGLAGDHIYLNQHLRREAGLCRTDTVLGASDARPFLD
ncbi:MAG: hypothetical protein EBV06_09555 [Planctomycetia bacterium]|nr:hypothetical protein [Planctomycetia bacterium]